EYLDRKILALVSPALQRPPARPARKRSELFYRIFVAVLCMDGFARAKLDGFSGHLRLLPLETGEVHFHAVPFPVVESVMLEAVELEVAAELAIHTREEVEI